MLNTDVQVFLKYSNDFNFLLDIITSRPFHFTTFQQVYSQDLN